MKRMNKFERVGWVRWIVLLALLGGLLGMSYATPADTSAAPLSTPLTLTWNTFLGGGSSDTSSAVALASDGDLFISGSSSASWGNPIRPYTMGGDAYVARLDPDGGLEWMTFLGGKGDDAGHYLAVDGSDNVYVTGSSSAGWGSPIKPYHKGSSDAYLAKVNSNGVLQWNTFFGGTGEGVSLGDWASGVTVDSSGDVYVVGTSSESWGTPLRPFPAASPYYAIFVAKINPGGALQWNTFLGSGLHSSINVDSLGNIYVSGSSIETWGTPIDPYYGDLDHFVAKLDPAGTLQWNTFLGAGSGEYAGGFAVDDSGNVYLTGLETGTSWGTPILPKISVYDAYLAKLNTDGGLIWNTFLGGTGHDGGSDVVLDGSNIYLLGWSRASWGTPQLPFSGGEDAFLANLDTDGLLLEQSFIGGAGIDSGSGIVIGAGSKLYVTGSSDATWGTPIRAYTADTDGFVVKLQSSALTWDLASDFRTSPNHANPNPDSYGNEAVWYFMENSLPLHQASNYTRIDTFYSDILHINGFQGWMGAEPVGAPNYHDGLPTVQMNKTGAPIDIFGGIYQPDVIITHPATEQPAIVGWRSPIGGTIAITGGVTDRNFGQPEWDGILWYIDKGSTNLASGSYPNGGHQLFKDGTKGDQLLKIYVNKGDFIYFVIAPGGSYYADATQLDVTITQLDITPPSVRLTKTGTDGSGHKFIEITARDRGFGIASIEVLRSQNANAEIPPFAPGTTDPIRIIFTKIDSAKQAIVSVGVTDVAGNVKIGDPVLQLLTVVKGKRVKQTFRDIPPAEHFIGVANGTPGLNRLKVKVNGKLFEVVELADGASTTIDVASAMVEGANKLNLVGIGKRGGSAFVIIGDSPLEAGSVLEGFTQAAQESPQENFGWGQVDRPE